jgi:uncharacterized repeat protein (TIGR03803 family)
VKKTFAVNFSRTIASPCRLLLAISVLLVEGQELQAAPERTPRWPEFLALSTKEAAMQPRISSTEQSAITFSAGRAMICLRALALTLLATSWIVFLHPVSSATETIVHSFSDNGDASNPTAGVILGKKGIFYGVTPLGGYFNDGAIYKVAPNGTEEVLYSFMNSDDGYSPNGNLIMDTGGNFYGAASGGANNSGTIFKLSASNDLTVLYTFEGGNDGFGPMGSMIFDKLGNLYGTTFRGGTSDAGTIFKLSPSGTHTVLYSFGGGSDGLYPNGALIFGSKGELFGTTAQGGSFGFGTLFKLSASLVHTVEWDFSGGADGGGPTGGLVLYKGLYFGTTHGGGTGANGIVYGWSPTHPYGLGIYWVFTGGADGGEPGAGVISDKEGNLYGTTGAGGANFEGTVYKLDVSTSPIAETVLHNFGLGPDGQFPLAGVVFDKSGNLYGTTSIGGSDSTCDGGYGCGIVFEVSP